MGHTRRTSRSDRRRRAAARDLGAALVEFGIVMVFLFTLVFGVIEFGIAFNDYQSVRQGAREGAREAVVRDVPFSSCAVDGTMDQTTRNLVCLTEARIGSGADTRVRVVTQAPSGVGRGTIRVCVQQRLESATGLLDPIIGGRILTTVAEMRVERGPTMVDGAAGEDPPPGGDWTFCP